VYKVREVQRLVRDVAKAKIRKAGPREYELPPTVLRAQTVCQQPPSWLETTENEINIIQPFHYSIANAKLRLHHKRTREDDETKLQHGAVIIVFRGVMYLPEPLDTPFLMHRLLIEPVDG
jgi:hypothetical protein